MKWRIEEANTGSTSETGLIVVYPDMIVDDLSACCQAMYTGHNEKDVRAGGYANVRQPNPVVFGCCLRVDA